MVSNVFDIVRVVGWYCFLFYIFWLYMWLYFFFYIDIVGVGFFLEEDEG